MPAQVRPDPASGLARISFRAMNTRVEVTARPEEARLAAGLVEEVFEEYERTLSRFLPASPLAELNRAGVYLRPPRVLVRAVRRAFYWRERFPGLFEPAVLPDLERLGYDRSFELLADGAAPPPRTPPRTAAQGARRTSPVRVDDDCIVLPRGVRIDLGGIGKGLAVDAAIRALKAEAVEVAMVNAGGDLRALGHPPDADAWRVSVPRPFAVEDEAEPLRVVHIRNQAVATSSTLGRRWTQGGVERHHLIDPRTGLPSTSPWVWVTVVAPDCETADVLAKVLLLAGPERAPALLRTVRGAHALWVDRDGASGVVGGRRHDAS